MATGDSKRRATRNPGPHSESDPNRETAPPIPTSVSGSKVETSRTPTTKKKAAAKKSAKRLPKKSTRKSPRGSKYAGSTIAAGGDVTKPKDVVANAAKAGLSSEAQVDRELNDRWAELSVQRRTAEEVLSRHIDELKCRPEVTGFHVGLRRKNKKVVFPLEYCIRVHVAAKHKEWHPMLVQMLPTELDGVKVDVLERSYNTALGIREGVFFDPLLGGVAIANATAPLHFGTLGLVVFSAIAGLLPHYLSNQHVVGSSGNVLQPPKGNTPAGSDAVIGNVVDSERSASIDAALIKPAGNRTFDFGVIGTNGNPLPGNLVPGVLTKADEHITKCFKIGAMTGTGQEVGVVENTSEHIMIEKFGWMDNQIVVRPTTDTVGKLIEEGDSGSVLIAHIRRPNQPDIFAVVGLVHAMTPTGEIVACHFNRIQERFRIRLFDIT